MGAAELATDYDWKLIPGLQNEPKLLVIDLFCGAGGTTIGYKLAKLRKELCALVIACINHDAKAIKSHWRNNKEVLHYNEDITKLYGHVKYNTLFMSDELIQLKRLVEIYRALYPNAKLVLWASLECTNFSKAKGGQARDADSRTLGEHLDRYIYVLQPDYVKIENVVEFMAWGPMRIKPKKVHNVEYPYTELCILKDKKTKEPVYGWEPISKKNGQYWMKWREDICNLGYVDSWKELNSADYGAYTSRNRLFGIFARPNLPMMFPTPTHAKKPSNENTLFDNKQKWNPVKHVLDFDDEGESIFNRIKPVATMVRARILLGKGKKVKEVILLPADLEQPHTHHPARFVIKATMLKDFNEIVEEYKMVYGSVSFWWDDPLVKPTCDRVLSGLIKYVAGGKQEHQAFIQQTYAASSNGDNNYSVDGVGRTITTRDSSQLVQATFLSTYNSGAPDSRNTSVDEPCRTLMTENTHAVVSTKFITKCYSGKPEHKNISIEGPAGTITTRDGQAIVDAQFLVQRNSGDPDGRIISVDGPARTLTATGGNQEMVSPSFIVASNGGNVSGKVTSVDNPSRVITTTDNKSLVQPSFITKQYSSGGQINSMEEPASTLTTKDRLAKVQTVWLDKHYSGEENHGSVESPAGTIMTKDKYSLVNTNWIDRNFSSGSQNSSIEDPAGTIMGVPKLNLVKPKFIFHTNYTNGATSLEDPAGVITANRKYHYLVNPQYLNGGSSVDKPCFTLIAKMDKRPPSLVVTEEGELAIEIYDTDNETMVKIKEFMAMYGIADIKMRMLKVPELLKIQGFPSSYHLEGSQADKKKFIGNSVVPHIVRCWAEQLALEIELSFPQEQLMYA